MITISSIAETRNAEYNYSILGGNGCDLITDTTAHTGTWRLMEIEADAVFTTFSCENIYVNGASTTMTETDLPAIKQVAGAKVYGVITEVQLTSGSVTLYK